MDDMFWKCDRDVIAAVHRLLFHRKCLLELPSKNGCNMVLPLKFMQAKRRQNFYSSWKEQKNEEFIAGIQSALTSSLQHKELFSNFLFLFIPQLTFSFGDFSFLQS